MEEKKLLTRTCPKCGNICLTAEVAKIVPSSIVHMNMTCEHGHKWTEFYSLAYQGFWWDGKKYDSYGEQV